VLKPGLDGISRDELFTENPNSPLANACIICNLIHRDVIGRSVPGLQRFTLAHILTVLRSSVPATSWTMVNATVGIHARL